MKVSFTGRGVHLLCSSVEYSVIRSALAERGILLPVELPK